MPWTFGGRIARGKAVKIMTGAPLSPGSDTVAPLEEVAVSAAHVRLERPVRKGNHVGVNLVLSGLHSYGG